MATTNEMAVFSLNSDSLMSTADFEQLSAQSGGNRLLRRARAEGTLDTALHNGNQIKTEDIIGKVLTLTQTGYAFAPAKTPQGEPIFEKDSEGNIRTDEDGVAIQAMSKFPVMKFAEAPGWWYNGGSRFMQILDSFIREVGDDPEDTMLPKVNKELSACGGIKCLFKWKDSTTNRGQKYVDILMG